jgi:hypothetical protein
MIILGGCSVDAPEALLLPATTFIEWGHDPSMCALTVPDAVLFSLFVWVSVLCFLFALFAVVFEAPPPSLPPPDHVV